LTDTRRFGWSTIPTDADIDAAHALTVSLDPRFAREARAFWESRTAAQLCAARAQAWDCCEPEPYAKARYYLARLAAKAATPIG
jgi:hypothetical protein